MTKILIVDDEQANLYLLQVLLSANGYALDLAANGVEALALARRAPPDLIISDILMPVMDGFALCRAWKEDARLKRIPFVFYTATYTDPKDEAFALSLGADRFIVKPAEPDKFLALLRETLAAHAAGSLTPPREMKGSESEYYQEYTAALIRKLEAKMQQLEAANRALELDIIERRQAEAALRKSEERFHTLYENSTVGLYRTTPDGRILLANPTLIKMLGFASFDELALRNLEQEGYGPGDSRSDFLERIEQEVEVRGLVSTWVRRDRMVVHVRESARAIRDSQGKTLYYDGTVEDITERKQAEEALLTERSLLRALVDHLPDAIYVKDTAGRKTLANPVDFRNMGAISEAEVLGKTDFELFPLDLATAFNADDQRVLQSGRPILNREEQVTLPDGTRGWQLTSKVPLLDSAGRVVGLVGVGHDITERKQAEERIGRQLAELQRWYEVTLTRETRALELKSEVNALLRRLNEPIRYPSAEISPPRKRED